MSLDQWLGPEDPSGVSPPQTYVEIHPERLTYAAPGTTTPLRTILLHFLEGCRIGEILVFPAHTIFFHKESPDPRVSGETDLVLWREREFDEDGTEREVCVFRRIVLIDQNLSIIRTDQFKLPRNVELPPYEETLGLVREIAEELGIVMQ